MDKLYSRKLTIELYGILPSIIALVCLEIHRNVYFGFWIQLGLVAALGGAAFALSRNVSLLLVGFFVLLDKAYFHHPFVSYLGAVVIGTELLTTAESKHRPVLLSATLSILVAGLVPTIFPVLAGPFCILLGLLSLLTLFFIARNVRDVHLFSNPLASLTPDLAENRHRFSIFCLTFLSFGSLTWGYLVQHLPNAGLAGMVHIACTILAVPMILHLFKIDALASLELSVLTSRREQLINDLTSTTAKLSALQTTSTSIELHRDTQLEKVRQEITSQRNSATKEIQAQADKANLDLQKALVVSKRRIDAELEAAYYHQPWDILTTHLCNKEKVAIPGGPTLCTEDHILLGLRTASGAGGTPDKMEPVFLHKDILHEHVHILGGTGSGKTSLGITPIAVQLLRGQPPNPLIFLDLKGDDALFHTAREEAERNNQDFLFFSLDSHKETFRFNPFAGIKTYGGTLNEQSQPILEALGLVHGEGYGKSFFTRVHRQRMFEALKRNPNIHTFAQLKEALSPKDTTGAKAPKQIPTNQRDELIAAVEGLAEYPQLFTTPDEEKAGKGIIQFDTVLEKSQVVYFWLPAPTQSISVREVGKLVLYNLFFAALKRKNEQEVKQAYLFIDEFQRIIGENLALFLEQSRSYGISLVLANHNIDQLNSSDVKLWPLVQSNVRASLHFGSGDPKEIELLSEASGEAFGTLKSFTKGKSSGSSRGATRGTSTSQTVSTTKGESSGGSISHGTADAVTQFTISDGRQWTESVSSSDTEAKGVSRSVGETESESQSTSAEETVSEYLRPALRPEDVRSVFNKNKHFFYWVRRGRPPLVDYGGKPVAVEGIYTLPKHLFTRRKLAKWPRLTSIPGHDIRTPVGYKSAQMVTEETIVKEVLATLESLKLPDED